MVSRALNLNQAETGRNGVLQTDQADFSRHERLRFPVLKLEKVKKQREEHKALLQGLFPNPVRLSRLIHDVEKSFAKEFASIIGSVDFAEQRLAGLLQALKELLEKVESAELSDHDKLREHISLDQRIHESFEELVFECAKFSLQEA